MNAATAKNGVTRGFPRTWRLPHGALAEKVHCHSTIATENRRNGDSLISHISRHPHAAKREWNICNCIYINYLQNISQVEVPPQNGS